MLRKENANGSHVMYVALYIKLSVVILFENIEFQILDVAFLILLSVLVPDHCHSGPGCSKLTRR